MATLQRHWRLATVTSVLLVLAGALGLLNVRDQAALAGPQKITPLSALAYDQVVDHLRLISLDRDALIGLNLTSQQAQAVLGATRDWHERNAAQLATLDAAIATATEALQEIEQAIAMGPAQEGQDQDLAEARQQLHSAQQAYVAALSPLRADVAKLLSASQNTTWAAIEAGYGSTMPLRLLALTSEQRGDLGRAHRHYQWRLAAAGSAQERSAAVAAWQSSLESILTVEQRGVLESFDRYQAASSQAVAEAFESVLAVATPQG